MDTDDPAELLMARWETLGIVEDDDAEPDDANIEHDQEPEDD